MILLTGRGMLVLIGIRKSKLFPARLASQARRASLCLFCRLVWNSLFNFFSSKLLNSTLSGVHHIPGPYINTYNKVSTKQAKGYKVFFVLFSIWFRAVTNVILIFFIYIDATGYWLRFGDFYSSSSCLEVFLIHDERSTHLVKPWIKVTEAMLNNHSTCMCMSSYFSLRHPFTIIRYNFWFSLFFLILF